jgi:predicted O-methyltransferase YrrM
MKEKLEELFTWPDEKPNIPLDEHHWFGNANSIVLEKLINELNPKFILEMGSWTGAGSTKFILNKAPNAHMVCIDHWSETLEGHGIQKAWGAEKVNEDFEHIKNLWKSFLLNTWEHRHHLTPIRKKTIEGLEVLRNLDISFDLIYIDAHHDYESVLSDIKLSGEIWPNAVICGDDYRWPDGGVAKAVHEYADNTNLNVNVLDQFWYYTKK